MSDGQLPNGLRPPEIASDGEIAAYVAEICRELRGLSRDPEFRLLNYLLDMVQSEAERVVKASRASGR